MRIAFISLNQERLPDPVVPIGLLSVMANTPARHDRMLLDLCFVKDVQSTIESEIRDFKPDLIALGLRNIQNNDYSSTRDNLNKCGAVIEFLRKICTAPLILGGSGFSVTPERLMTRLRPDYGIAGEGEIEFPKFLEALESGTRDFSRVGSFHYFEGNRLVSQPRQGGFLDLDAVKGPDVTMADPRYFQDWGTANVQTKRGCPLGCTYCTYPTVEGRSRRLREPSRVVDELLSAVSRQPLISHFFIVDSVFNLPATHAKAICREMIQRKFRVPWTCYVNPIGFDEELAALMAEAGCTGMEIGSDSGSDRVLKELKKGFTKREIQELSRISRSKGLKECHSFILGTPGETLEDVRETLDFISELDPYCAILGVWVDDEEAVDPARLAGRIEFRERVKEIIAAELPTHPFWVVPALRVNFDEKIFAFLRRRKFNGPLWQHIRLVASSIVARAGLAGAGVPPQANL